MRLVQSIIHKLINNDLLPFLILGILIVIIHSMIPIPISDDVNYSLVGMDWFTVEFLEYRYNTWSSGLIPESMIILLLKAPHIIWRVLDSLVYTLLGVTISSLIGSRYKKTTNWFICLLLLVFPFGELASAGWITTTVNYLWPLLFGLIALRALKKILLKEELYNIEKIVSIFSLFLAVNHEILCLFLTLIFFGSACYQIARKSVHWFVFTGLGLCISSLVWIFSSPGNIFRADKELRWFQDFNHISWIDKLEIGISSTLTWYVFELDLIMLVFCILLLVIIWSKHRSLFHRIYILIPVLVVILFGILPNMANWLSVFIGGDMENKISQLPIIKMLQIPMTKYGIISLENFTRLKPWLTIGLLYVTAGMLLISVYIALGNTTQRMVVLGILILGFGTRLTTAFLPTIWASGSRTFFLFTSSIIIGSVLIFQTFLELNGTEKAKKFLIFVGFLAGLSYTQLILSI